VLHHCDNPACVNPAHLFLGTHLDNARDMVRKGRHSRGERQSQAKLSDAKVLEILKSPMERSDVLAARYGVHVTVVLRIRAGRDWKHVNREEAARV
jgi:hypothetical protein